MCYITKDHIRWIIAIELIIIIPLIGINTYITYFYEEDDNDDLFDLKSDIIAMEMEKLKSFKAIIMIESPDYYDDIDEIINFYSEQSFINYNFLDDRITHEEWVLYMLELDTAYYSDNRFIKQVIEIPRELVVKEIDK